MPSLASRWPAHATSTGKAILAYLTQPEREELLPAKLQAFTPRTITSRDKLEKELSRVRARGYSLAVEELELGFTAVGAPIRSAAGTVVAAISVGGPKSRLSPERVIAVARYVSEGAERISRRLGCTDPSSAKRSGLYRRWHKEQ
jgi:DNA-binding IclR family transcriptional regulator